PRGGSAPRCRRGRRGLAVFAMLAAMAAAAAAALVVLAMLACFRGLGRARCLALPGDGLSDQLLDRGDALAVGGRNDGDCGAAPPGAAGAADAMHVIDGMMRHIEVEDVADGGNIEAARGDVGGDQQR